MISSLLEFLNVYSLLACIIALLWYYSQSSYNYWRRLNVPFLKPVPFFGNIAAIVLQRKTNHETYEELYKALHDLPFGGIYEMRDPVLMLKDPQLISSITVSDFNYFHDRKSRFAVNVNRKLNPVFNGNIMSAEGERWRILRHKMKSFFSPGQVRKMYEKISHCAVSTIEFIDAQVEEYGSVGLNVKPIVDRYAIDVIGSCGFGIECTSIESKEEFVQMCDESLKPNFATTVRLIVCSFSERLLTLLNLPNMKKEISDFFLNLTLDIVKYRRDNGVVRNDLLQLLMNLQNSHHDPKFAVGGEKNIPESEKFDEIDIAAHTFIFFIASHEAISGTVSFCIYELALNEEIQQRLRSEVLLVLDKCKVIDYESLKEMTYMDAVIAETLRKYSPLATVTRKCTEDYIIPNSEVRIRAGTRVIVPVWAIHHDCRYYPNPEIFDPDRFLNGNKQRQPNGVYFPYGNGPRYCLGKLFAEIEMKAVLAEMILKYDIKPCAKTEIPLTFIEGSLFLIAKHGIWINLSRRL